jgi:hypothetical protein
VGGAIHHPSQRLPFPLLGLDSDNGGEFINHHLYAYYQRKQNTFTRSRPCRKNDSAHVKQKNWEGCFFPIALTGLSQGDRVPRCLDRPNRPFLLDTFDMTDDRRGPSSVCEP